MTDDPPKTQKMRHHPRAPRIPGKRIIDGLRDAVAHAKGDTAARAVAAERERCLRIIREEFAAAHLAGRQLP